MSFLLRNKELGISWFSIYVSVEEKEAVNGETKPGVTGNCETGRNECFLKLLHWVKPCQNYGGYQYVAIKQWSRK